MSRILFPDTCSRCGCTEERIREDGCCSWCADIDDEQDELIGDDGP